MENNTDIKQEEEKQNEKIDYTCPICLLIMAEPIQFPCKHHVCYECVRNIDEQSINTNCPLCRKQVPLKNLRNNMKINNQLQKEIQIKYPQEFKEVKKQLQEFKQKDLTYTKVYFSYGNTHQLKENIKPGKKYTNNHEWVCYFKLHQSSNNEDITKYIRKVEFTLDDSFGYPLMNIKSPPYQIKMTGYATFPIPIKIYWQRWLRQENTEIIHNLSFEGKGTSKQFVLKIDNIKIQQIQQDIQQKQKQQYGSKYVQKIFVNNKK